ncbi:MAG: ABC transporter permease [Candidatus Omnitrophica bacterium]|nr:ABC transporter permease [Candidatus Omnitrophota bacterium]MCM8799960.1 ABC transporter permease [Candidatus Omnitrophota bacterium]
MKNFLLQKTIIKPLSGWVPINLKEIWDYRELLYFFIWREIKLRYKQTALGILWVIIQPFFLMVVFSLFFGRLTKLSSEGLPYPLFTYSALLPWMLFVEGVSRSVNFMLQETNLIKKVYFPRIIMPLAGVLSPLIDFLISFVIFLGLMFYFKFTPSFKIIIWLPLLVFFTLLTALASGLWFSAINVQYRDMRYVMPFIIQLWFFASPVVYSTNLLPSSWKIIYNLNPMVGIIEGFRWVLLGIESNYFCWDIWIAVVGIILISGLLFFRQMEKNFADIV